jgi:hypothetical protein
MQFNIALSYRRPRRNRGRGPRRAMSSGLAPDALD